MMDESKSLKRMPVRFITIEEGGQRIDNFLLNYLKHVPKSHIYQLIRKGQVRVNKKRIDASYRLHEQDQLRLPPLYTKESEVKRAPDRLLRVIASQIIYEDNFFIVVNKPAGVAVHGGSGLSFGIIEAVRQIRPQEKHLALAHRLDRETSGCLLMVKKTSILREVHQLLREGGIEKQYFAFLKGPIRFKEKTIEAPLKKFNLQGGERVVRSSSEGKPAKTVFIVEKHFPLGSLVKAKPITGRTHQIRVHAALMKHPIAGDDKYGDKIFNKEIQKKGLKRLFLHSAYLKFTLPSSQQVYEFQSPLMQDLDDFLQKCGK
ncbi:MAG: hypothetical protein ACD_44C00162G0002 [uncultured bacterium]|nr:MAG: hypothetical protein ACD_44C00162G0002 [uncultured bacterium]